MNTLLRRHLLRPLNRRPRQLVEQSSLARAIERLEGQALGAHVLVQLRPKLRALKKGRKRGSWSDPDRAREMVSTVLILYASRTISISDFVFFASAPVAYVHDERITNGVYAAELDPIERRIIEIEKEHGLTEA